MIINLEETKLWLREDSDDPLVLNQIEMIIGAAEMYLYNATGIEFDSSNHLAKMFCLVLVTDWYENRELIGSQPSDKVRLTIQSMTAQLQYSYDTIPPKIPTGLIAVAGDGIAELSWEVNTEGDLAGYNVYQGGAKITAELVVMNSYQIIGLINGATYEFQVTAVDLNKNESKRSIAVSVTPTS